MVKEWPSASLSFYFHCLQHGYLHAGKVEWRGDPREAHRRYLSSWDLSVISDAEEAEHDPESGDEGGDNSQPIAIMEKVDNSPVQTEESASISSDYLQSLLNAASGQQGGSLDSLQSVGVLDSPLISRNSDSAGMISLYRTVSFTIDY